MAPNTSLLYFETDVQLISTARKIAGEKGVQLNYIPGPPTPIKSPLNDLLNRVGVISDRLTVMKARVSLKKASMERHKGAGEQGIPEEPACEPGKESEAKVVAMIQCILPKIATEDAKDIYRHAWSNGRIGLATTETLVKRVHLAIGAHIRHKHTVYDNIQQLNGKASARAMVEPAIVKKFLEWAAEEVSEELATAASSVAKERDLGQTAGSLAGRVIAPPGWYTVQYRPGVHWQGASGFRLGSAFLNYRLGQAPLDSYTSDGMIWRCQGYISKNLVSPLLTILELGFGARGHSSVDHS
ncbi:hypothetical protein MBLNU230_g1880t1 [Neophaeotheca triangularis]